MRISRDVPLSLFLLISPWIGELNEWMKNSEREQSFPLFPYYIVKEILSAAKFAVGY